MAVFNELSTQFSNLARLHLVTKYFNLPTLKQVSDNQLSLSFQELRTKLTPLRMKNKGKQSGGCGIKKVGKMHSSQGQRNVQLNKEQNVLSKEKTNQNVFKFISKDSLQVSKDPEASSSLKSLNYQIHIKHLFCYS